MESNDAGLPLTQVVVNHGEEIAAQVGKGPLLRLAAGPQIRQPFLVGAPAHRAGPGQ